MIRKWFVCVSLLSTVLVAGCGGSDSLSSVEIIVEAQPVTITTDGIVIGDNKIESDITNHLIIPLSTDMTQLPELTLVMTNANGDPLQTHTLEYSAHFSNEREIVIDYTVHNQTQVLHRDHPLSLTFESTALTIRQKVDFLLYDVPQMSKLDWPQRTLFIDQSVIDLMVEQGKIEFQWLNLGQWQVPQNPDWHEDPYDNITWAMLYHSMGWLTPLGHHYLQTGDQQTLDKIDRYLNDYDNTFGDPHNASPAIAYREDAVSLRINHLLYFYLNIYRGMPSEKRVVIESLLAKDMMMLQVYLLDPNYDTTNHGLIQARSGFNLVASLPRYTLSPAVLASALARVDVLSNSMFAADSGLSVEQAVDYHFVLISMFLEAKQQMGLLGISAPQDMMDSLSRSIGLAAYLMFEDGSIPAIGNSYYNNNWSEAFARHVDAYQQPIEGVAAFFAEGQDALDDFKVVTDEGLIIAKHRHSTDQSLSKVFFDVGKKRIIHGHFDNLNVIGVLAGERLLVDSGGPYNYSYQERFNFQSMRAHNALIINDQIENQFDSVLDFHQQTNSSLMAGGTLKTTNSIDHRRAFALTKGDKATLLVVDQVVQTGSGNNAFEELWHFAPQTSMVEMDASTTRLTLASGTVFQHYHKMADVSQCEVVEGQNDSDGIAYLGWITAQYNVATPAPVKRCQSNSNNYLKVNVFSNDMDLQPSVTDLGDSLEILLGAHRYYYTKADNRLTD